MDEIEIERRTTPLYGNQGDEVGSFSLLVSVVDESGSGCGGERGMKLVVILWPTEEEDVLREMACQ